MKHSQYEDTMNSAAAFVAAYGFVGCSLEHSVLPSCNQKQISSELLFDLFDKASTIAQWLFQNKVIK